MFFFLSQIFKCFLKFSLKLRLVLFSLMLLCFVTQWKQVKHILRFINSDLKPSFKHKKSHDVSR